jgi:flagellar hook-associated protein 1 FlgK
MSIGLSGLRAAQAGLSTTGHNIANVNTPGFSRQQTVLTPSTAQFSGAGYIGTGVTVSTVQRIYSDFLTQSLRDSKASSASASAYAGEVSRVDGFLADSSSNLSSSADSFFASVQAVANNPGDSASRQTMLSTARTFAARFNDLNGRLLAQGADVNQQIDDAVVSVNTLAEQVATLNAAILNNGGTSGNQVPNDLLDQRDALMQQISAAVGATSMPQSDGTLNVFIGNGQPLVVGTQVNALSTVPDDQDPSKKQLAVTVNGQPQRVQTSQVTQGTVGGLFKFRDQVLSPTMNALGQIAIGVSSALNAQNALGQDANGNLGGPLFTNGSPAVAGRSSNSATAAIAVTFADPSKLTTADYRLDYDGTNYTLTNLSDQSTHSYASLPQTVDGIKIAVTGALSAGDRFTISPTKNGARDLAVATTDPSKIATAAPIALSAAASNTGGAKVNTLSVIPASPLPSNLQAPVNVVFHVSGSTTTYDLTDGSNNVLSSGNAYTDGATISQNGWNLTLIGAPANGDTFTVGPNVSGTGDNRNALLLAAVQQKTVTLAGSAQDTYNGLVGLIGNKSNEATSLSTSEDSLLTQAQDNRDSVSGVNLDEEAANLTKYQQAYQAAAKSIATATAMFDSILGLFAA